MDRSNLLGEEKISSLLLKFSIPAIIGMMANALYNVIDRMVVGNKIGSDGLAGITIGFPIMLIMMAFMMLIGIGATSLISISLGEKKKDEAELILGNTIVLLIIMSVIITALGLIFMDPMLKLFGASENVLPYARAYMTIILLGTIFQSIGFGLNNIIRGEGDPKTAMLTMLISVILNAILAPIFIFIFNWGIHGAAFATVLSQAVSGIWVFLYFATGKSLLKIHKNHLILHGNVVLKILAIGSAPFALQLAASLVNVIMNKSLGFYQGDLAISAMGIINSIAMLILMPIFGINQGVQPIIGFNYGAQNFNRVKQALKLAIIAATAIVCLGFIFIMSLSKQLISLFNPSDYELIKFGAYGLRTFLIFLPIIGFQIVSANYFQAVGKPQKAMLLSLSRQVLFLIPALLLLPVYFGIHGVFMAGPLADLVSSVVTAFFLFYELRHLDRRHQESSGENENGEMDFGFESNK